jgi:hypothetical protein
MSSFKKQWALFAQQRLQSMHPPILRPLILIELALNPASAAPFEKDAASVSLFPFLLGLPSNTVIFFNIKEPPYI